MNYAPGNRGYFNDLLKYCQCGKVIPFVGAGLSVFANRLSGYENNFYTWWRYLAIHYKDSFGSELSENADLFKTANDIESAESPKVFYDNIRVTYGGNLGDEDWNVILEKAKDEAIALIPRIFHGPIITSNFDQILEKVCNIESKNVLLPYNIDTLEDITNTIKYSKHSLYKIHGSVTDVEKIVFTGKSYDMAYSRDMQLVKTLTEFYKGFCFLFIGCSLNMSEDDMDKSVKLWTQLTHSGMFHYAFIACNEKNMSSRFQELSKYSIKPIFFPENRFECIKIILEELIHQSEQINLKVPNYKSYYIQLFDQKTSFEDLLHNYLMNNSPSIINICGMGGIGKTRLACEYAHKFITKYDSGVFFINAYSQENVRAQMYVFAEQVLGINEESSYSDIIKELQRWLNNNNNWLIILDNVEHFHDISELLQYDYTQTDGFNHFIITSRKKFREVISIELKQFDIESALEFLFTQTGQICNEAAKGIARNLGCLPLALEQASSFIKKQAISYKSYLDLLEASLNEKIYLGEFEGNSLPVQATYNVSLRMISNEAAKQLINICSFLAPERISIQWFKETRKQILSPLRRALNSDEELDTVLYELEEYSLLKIENNRIFIHRMIQEAVKKMLNKKKYLRVCINIFDRVIDIDFSNANNRLLFQEVLSHIVSILSQITWKIKQRNVGNLYNYIGVGYYEFCDFLNAKKYLTMSLKFHKTTYGKEHARTAIAYNNLASILKSIGLYKESELLYKRAIEIDVKNNGANHVLVAIDKSNLGELLTDLNRFEDGEIYLKEALQIYDTLNITPNTTVLNNLAEIFRLTGRFSDAESLYRRALKIDEELYGSQHPEVATVLNNLALLLESTARFNEAEQLSRKALKIDMEVYGEDHHRIAKDVSSLATIVEHKNQFSEAEEYYLKALHINEKIFGKISSEVSRDLINLGILYETLGRNEDSKAIYFRALQIDKNLGFDIDVARDLNALAGLLANEKQIEKAMQYYEQALNIYEDHYGPDSLDVAIVLRNIASILYEKECYQEAEKTLCRHIEILINNSVVNGQVHPDLQDALDIYVEIVKSLGGFKGHQITIEVILSTLLKKLGYTFLPNILVKNNSNGS